MQRAGFGGDLLDVEHRVAGLAGEAGEGEMVEGMAEGVRNFIPGAFDGVAGISAGRDGGQKECGVHGFNDLAEGDLVCGASEKVAAGHATAAFDEAGAAEIVEDLDEEVS